MRLQKWANPTWLQVLQGGFITLSLIGLLLIGIGLYGDVTGDTVALRDFPLFGVVLALPGTFFTLGRTMQARAEQQQEKTGGPS